jgi:hypothetical protein
MYLMNIKYPKALLIMLLNSKNIYILKTLKRFENNTFLKFFNINFNIIVNQG